MSPNELQQLERATFRAAADTGLWDVFLASFFAIFAIAPFLSPTLGDFWSSAIFLPFWAAVYFIVRAVNARVVVPRVGFVEYGKARRARLQRLSQIMVAVNLLALAAGIYLATRPNAGQSSLPVVTFPLMLLAAFSLGAFFLDVPRLFFYGALLAAAPVVGEVLYRRGYASHHGFPVAFGVASAIILVSGLMRFRLVLRKKPGRDARPDEEDR